MVFRIVPTLASLSLSESVFLVQSNCYYRHLWLSSSYSPPPFSLSGFLTSACAVSVLFACLPAETRERFVPADVVLSELLLFRELQTIVSAVAFARGTRGMLVGTKDLPKLACWLRASQI